jgi:hypothetical protein
MSSLSPGSALGGPGEKVWTPKNKMLLNIFTHHTPGSQNSSGAIRVWVTSLCQDSARGEACVKCGGKETTLGTHAPTRGASPNM